MIEWNLYKLYKKAALFKLGYNGGSQNIFTKKRLNSLLSRKTDVRL